MPDFDWDAASPNQRSRWIVQTFGIKCRWAAETPDETTTCCPLSGTYDDAVSACRDPVMAQSPLEPVPCWDYQNPARDYEILERVRDARWIDEHEDTLNRFWTHLAEILRSRDPYYRDTVNQRELYYMLEYRPGDFSHAAWLALRETAAATQETTHERR